MNSSGDVELDSEEIEWTVEIEGSGNKVVEEFSLADSTIRQDFKIDLLQVMFELISTRMRFTELHLQLKTFLERRRDELRDKTLGYINLFTSAPATLRDESSDRVSRFIDAVEAVLTAIEDPILVQRLSIQASDK